MPTIDVLNALTEEEVLDQLIELLYPDWRIEMEYTAEDAVWRMTSHGPHRLTVVIQEEYGPVQRPAQEIYRTIMQRAIIEGIREVVYWNRKRERQTVVAGGKPRGWWQRACFRLAAWVDGVQMVDRNEYVRIPNDFRSMYTMRQMINQGYTLDEVGRWTAAYWMRKPKIKLI